MYFYFSVIDLNTSTVYKAIKHLFVLTPH